MHNLHLEIFLVEPVAKAGQAKISKLVYAVSSCVKVFGFDIQMRYVPLQVQVRKTFANLTHNITNHI